jgi:alpha-methylacyl-CoA racemase
MRRAQRKTITGPLAGVRIIDMSRLAPGPYCTMLLADMGAEVIVVGGGRAGAPIPELSRGKTFVELNLKSPEGKAALYKLIETADVFVEGFRPGVADRIGAGYEDLAAKNPKLIYCSLTGYGQSGVRAQEAGHDINYISLTGVLNSCGRSTEAPMPPLNLVADFAGGSLVAALGILAALFECKTSGRGQYIDAAMIDGSLSLMAMHFPLWQTQWWQGRGDGLLAGDKPFYRTYACADDKYVAVGALERGFFVALWTLLELGEPPDHMARSNWPQIEETLSRTFKKRTRDQWREVFDGTDACVTPVLEPHEVWNEPHIADRHPGGGARKVPAVPVFSRTPARMGVLDLSDQSAAVLRELGCSEKDIRAATEKTERTGLSWPPDIGS